MSDSSDQPWSNGLNAAQIPYSIYTMEKGNFAGSVIAAVLYGIVVALFFRCMSALLLPVHPTTKGVRWGLVAHTVAMFSFSTIGFAINRDVFSMSYIDNREFTGIVPGPIGFLTFGSPIRQAIGDLSLLMFPFNQWLADGLLLYRCFVIYSKNYWAIALPSLMYLASIAMGIVWCYYLAKVEVTQRGIVLNTQFHLISLVLNVLLTLMIIIRLALHTRNIRNALGASSGLGGLYTALIIMLVESSALNAVGYLLFIISGSVHSFVWYIFSPILGEIQVISVFLIVLRVTNRTALTSEAVASGNISSIRFRTGEGSTGGPMPSSNGETPGRVGPEVETGSQET